MLRYGYLFAIALGFLTLLAQAATASPGGFVP